MRERGFSPAGIMRVLNVGKGSAEPSASRSRASKTGCGGPSGSEAVRAIFISPYGGARWMGKSGARPWEVAAQLGHSVGKEYAVTEKYAFYSPDYLSGAVGALTGSSG